MRRVPLLLMGLFLGGLCSVLPFSVAEAAANDDIVVTIETEVDLALDKSDPANPVVSGEGDIYMTTADALSHKHVAVSIPDEFEMTTPVGTVSAPEGTTVVYDGSMNARNGYENYRIKNGQAGNYGNSMYIGKIRVSIPFTDVFNDYGAGSYSLSIPVSIQANTAYGTYDSSLNFTSWDELVSNGGISLSGTKLYSVKKKDMIMEIDPSITGISASFTYTTYKEVDVPSSVTSGYHVFQNSPVEKIVFGEGFTTIPSDFCYSATNLTDVVLPDTVTSFKSDCFRNCTNLKNINLPSEMTLASTCFAYCRNIEELHITDGVKVSASAANYGPFVGAGLKKVVVEDGTTTVPNYICAGCEDITEVYFPDTLTSLGSRSFTGMQGLEEVTIKSDIVRSNTTLPCFENTGIKTITFTSGVTKIPRYMFENGCSKATTINLPDTLTEIGASAFSGCTSLTALEIPTSVQLLGGDCFRSAADLKELHIRGDYAMPKGTVVSPFRYSGIEKLVVEEGVTTIVSHMFDDGCYDMSELVLPTSLATIGGDAFRNCTSLKSLTVRSNADIPKSTIVSPFRGGDLESITYLGGVTLVGAHLFDGACESLTALTLPNTLVEIKAAAFSGCSSLTELEIPLSVNTLGASCFSNATSLKELHIRKNYSLPQSVTTSPFEYSGIEKLVFEEGVTTIVPHLFDTGCSSMTELVLPSTVTSIGGDAFENCTSLKSVFIPSDINVPYATVVSPFRGGDIESITFADGVTRTGDYFFSEACASLTELTFPESMEKIGYKTFEGCISLADLYIPPAVKEIGGEAFKNCTSLHALNMNSAFGRPTGSYTSPFELGGLETVNVANGVTELKTNFLNNADGSQIAINIPTSVTKIGARVFSDDADYIVYYGGTEAQWAAINKDSTFTPTDVICSDTVRGLMMMDMLDMDAMDAPILEDETEPVDTEDDGTETADGEPEELQDMPESEESTDGEELADAVPEVGSESEVPVVQEEIAEETGEGGAEDIGNIDNPEDDSNENDEDSCETEEEIPDGGGDDLPASDSDGDNTEELALISMDIGTVPDGDEAHDPDQVVIEDDPVDEEPGSDDAEEETFSEDDACTDEQSDGDDMELVGMMFGASLQEDISEDTAEASVDDEPDISDDSVTEETEDFIAGDDISDDGSEEDIPVEADSEDDEDGEEMNAHDG